jgi:hypothetical protein
MGSVKNQSSCRGYAGEIGSVLSFGSLAIRDANSNSQPPWKKLFWTEKM